MLKEQQTIYFFLIYHLLPTPTLNVHAFVLILTNVFPLVSYPRHHPLDLRPDEAAADRRRAWQERSSLP